MPSVCFYFEVHQPFRVRPYDAFQIGQSHDYFDDKLNREVMRKVANKCYLPANAAIQRLIERYDGRFRVAYSITGVALEQMKLYAPEVLESFQRLVATGAVELLAETYYHSLSVLYDVAEFRAQVELHTKLLQELFGVTPRVFRNTELIYDDRIGREVAALGFKAMIAEGADDVLDWRSPNFVYRMAEADTALLLKNYRLSDDIAFRFSNRQWNDFPLTSEKFAQWVHGVSGSGDTVNLFMDYETFGEHQWPETGIFEFLDHLPGALLAHPHWDFRTPSEVVAGYPWIAPISFHRTTSWADVERDLTAWRGNDMQDRALARIYELGERVRHRNNPALLSLWRKLQTSDHFYYMCTKWFADGDVHAYFSPYESPYEAFINYMNALSDLEDHVLVRPPVSPRTQGETTRIQPEPTRAPNASVRASS
jgi:alpha-amylase